MATTTLTPTDTPTRHRYRHRRRSSRVNASFTVNADASLTMDDQVFRPHVTYSVKKQGRWRLLDTANTNPASLFDDDTSPANLQLTVANSTKTRSGYRFYNRCESHTVDIARKSLNLPSLRRMVALNDSNTSAASAASVDFVDTRKQHDRSNRQKQPLLVQVAKKISINRKRMALNNLSRDMALDAEDEWLEEEEEEEEEDEHWEEEEAEEEDNCDHHTALSSLLPTTQPTRPSHDSNSARGQSPIPDDFDIVADAEAVQCLPDKEEESCLPSALVSLPSADLSATTLRRLFDGAFVDGADHPRLFAVDISDRLFSTRRPLHAYVIFEEVGDDRLAVRLNCVGHQNCRLPDMDEVASVSAVIDTCVETCIARYPSSVQRMGKLVSVTGYAIPADSAASVQVVSADGEYAAAATGDSPGPVATHQELEQYCGVCFDAVRPGRFCALSSCRHPFCEACWRRHLLSEIDAGRNDLRCPSFGCQRSVDLVTRLRLVPIDVLRSHHRHTLAAQMDSNPDLVWCPRSTCSRAIQLVGLRELRGCDQDSPLPINAVCSCDTAFCPHCRLEAHWPAPCAIYRAFADELERVGDQWRPVWCPSSHTPIRVRAKRCPQCQQLWEKNGGCNLMRCYVCLGYFYWHDREEPPPLEFVIQPTFTSLHLRRLAEEASLPNLRRRYARLLHRAIAVTGAATDNAAASWSMFKPVSDMAQAAQFSLVTSMAVESQEYAMIFRCFSERFEALCVHALEGLRSLAVADYPRTRKDALIRLRTCQEEGHRASRELQAILISWRRVAGEHASS